MKVHRSEDRDETQFENVECNAFIKIKVSLYEFIGLNFNRLRVKWKPLSNSFRKLGENRTQEVKKSNNEESLDAASERGRFQFYYAINNQQLFSK